MLEESQLWFHLRLIITLRRKTALAPSAAPQHPNSTSSASNALFLSIPPTAAKRNQAFVESAPLFPKPSCGTPRVHTRGVPQEGFGKSGADSKIGRAHV